MEYLNLEAHVFRSPEFIGADPVQRGTWIALQGWCASQENGGRIVGCRQWKDRMWQQLLGVTAEEVLQDSPLWTWDGDDLLVIHYPVEQERALHNKRDGNSRGGKATSDAKVEAARANGARGGRPPKPTPEENPTQTQLETEPEPNVKEGKVKESNGREGNRAGAEPAALSPSLLSSFDRVKIHLEAVFPNATKNLSSREREALHENAPVLDEFTDDDWLAARCWVLCPERVRDRDLWPRDRLEFIQNAVQAIEQIRPWWKRAGRRWWDGQQSKREPQVSPPLEPAEEPGSAILLWKSLDQDVA